MLVMILARRTGYDPDPFELTCTCGTMEYEDTHNRQMLDCGSIVSWMGGPCESMSSAGCQQRGISRLHTLEERMSE